MIDSFALVLSHGLLLLAAWRLIGRDDLDDDSVPAPTSRTGRRPFVKPRAKTQGGEAGGA